MMIRSAVTISLVPEARGGPFVFWDDLAEGCRKAAELGFDAVEVFAPSAESLESEQIGQLLGRHGLKLAALGTGAGFVLHQLTLTAMDSEVREKARNFVRSLIDAAASFGAPAIVGSMQGKWGGEVGRNVAMAHLANALNDLGEHAEGRGVPLLYEPLNRYETNLVNTLSDGVNLLRSLKTSNVKPLADLFHMNIEEVDLPSAVRAARGYIGHVHFADSNRRPAGGGHTRFGPVIEALREIGYDGYASVEAFPHPDPDAAAQLAIDAHRRYFGPASATTR